jgi:NAD(P)-dependent dehydrogenase (short-subunit alcohol dehydrogenase family)
MQADITLERPEEFQHAFDVNVIGTYHAAHYFLPLLLNTPKGAMAFIVISSTAASIVANPIASIHYCTSKMAQARVVEMIKEQYGSKGIFCASVHPGAVVSELSFALPQAYRHSENLVLR